MTWKDRKESTDRPAQSSTMFTILQPPKEWANHDVVEMAKTNQTFPTMWLHSTRPSNTTHRKNTPLACKQHPGITQTIPPVITLQISLQPQIGQEKLPPAHAASEQPSAPPYNQSALYHLIASPSLQDLQLLLLLLLIIRIGPPRLPNREDLPPKQCQLRS